MDANLALVMLLGLVLFVAGYFLSNKFKEEREEGVTFLSATFISRRGNSISIAADETWRSGFCNGRHYADVFIRLSNVCNGIAKKTY